MFEGLQHIWRSFTYASNLEPLVLPRLVAVILSSDDLAPKTLDVVGLFIVWGVLNGVLSLELLKWEVGEAIDAVQHPQGYQRLDRIGIQRGDADVQIGQGLPEEQMEGQPESLLETIHIESSVPGGRSGRVS